MVVRGFEGNSVHWRGMRSSPTSGISESLGLRRPSLHVSISLDLRCTFAGDKGSGHPLHASDPCTSVALVEWKGSSLRSAAVVPAAPSRPSPAQAGVLKVSPI